MAHDMFNSRPKIKKGMGKRWEEGLRVLASVTKALLLLV